MSVRFICVLALAVICGASCFADSEADSWRERHQRKSNAAAKIIFKATATIRARLVLVFIRNSSL